MVVSLWVLGSPKDDAEFLAEVVVVVVMVVHNVEFGVPVELGAVFAGQAESVETRRDVYYHSDSIQIMQEVESAVQVAPAPCLPQGPVSKMLLAFANDDASYPVVHFPLFHLPLS